MDSKALERIEQNTELLTEFADIPDKLRRIASYMDANPKSQKDLIAIGKFLESDGKELLSPLMQSAIAVFDLLCSNQFYSFQISGNHIVDCITAATANANNFDFGSQIL